MILLLDTSTPLCHVSLVHNSRHDRYEWEAGRELARGLHAYLRDRLAEHGAAFHDLTGIGVMQGPGSFTGLRIGVTVANTLAESLDIPIVAARGDSWQDEALARLATGDNDHLVMPYYGSEAHITQPRK